MKESILKYNHLALDVGNVLVKVDMTEFVGKISSLYGVSIDEACIFLRRSQKAHDLGLTSIKDEVKTYFGENSESVIDDILDCWNNSLTPNYDMLNMLASLELKDMALLSNIGVEHAALMDTMLKYDGLYFNRHFSCEVGARKPNKLFYQSFLMQYPKFEQCLYIDDLQENLDAGADFLEHTYRFSLHDPDVSGNIRRLKGHIEDKDCFW